MEKRKIIIVIATTSDDKIEGIKEAFLKYFSAEQYEIKIYSSKAESGVPEQPFGNDTYQGAYNRINNVKEKYEEKLKKKEIIVDYYVSCEAGIDNTNKVLKDGQYVPIYVSEQIVCIYNPKTDIYSFGKSSSWNIPQEDIKEIEDTNLDQYLRKRKCTGLHDIGDGKYITRKDAVREGTESAIASILFQERCNKSKNELTTKDSEHESNK